MVIMRPVNLQSDWLHPVIFHEPMKGAMGSEGGGGGGSSFSVFFLVGLVFCVVVSLFFPSGDDFCAGSVCAATVETVSEIKTNRLNVKTKSL